MTQPTIDQLRNLTDRAATGLTPDEQQRLRDGIDQLARATHGELWQQLADAIRALGKSETELAALRQVARGYCPACGRGDAAPTVGDWEQQRQRAEAAETALDRVRRLAARIRHGAPWTANHDNLADRIIAALDGEQQAGVGQSCSADNPNNPATQPRPWSTCTVSVDHDPHPWHDPRPLPDGQEAHCPGKPTPEPERCTCAGVGFGDGTCRLHHPDATPPELTAEEARDLADELGTELYRAQDALAFVAECCDITDREQQAITTADVREWLKGARCGRQLLAEAAAVPDGTVTTEPATAWTPPPPGDTREQLPDAVLALIDVPPYTSTACEAATLLARQMPKHTHRRIELGEHSDRLHARCRRNNKFTGALCGCHCHTDTKEN